MRTPSRSNPATAPPTISGTDFCDFRTATSSKNASGDGYINMNLRATAGSTCYMRLCESLLPNQLIP